VPARFRMSDPQLSFEDLRIRRWGGRRSGTGRPRMVHSRVAHRSRRPFGAAIQAHVTVRLHRGLPSLRSKRLVRELRRSLRAVREREGEFRVLHYALQRDHAHLIVEASDRGALASGMKAVGARLARAVNRVFERSGPVLDGRYHLRPLRTPREVRRALAYVLLNVRHHWWRRCGAVPPPRIDAASSGRWFVGWSALPPGHEACGEAEVSSARTWLVRVGWQRHGLIDPREIPGSRR